MGDLAVLAEWMYARLPEAEKEEELAQTVIHHTLMAQIISTRNYTTSRAALARRQ